MQLMESEDVGILWFDHKSYINTQGIAKALEA